MERVGTENRDTAAKYRFDDDKEFTPSLKDLLRTHRMMGVWFREQSGEDRRHDDSLR